MIYLLLLTAFSLSAVAAWYSIAGLMAIFASMPVAIAIMGGALEVSKLVVTSWLYRNWSETPRLLKSYFVTAIAVLMLLTSMGIYGFLSKAHSDQSLVTGDAQAKLLLIDEQITIEKESIDANRKVIAQLDQQVNQALDRTTTARGVDRSNTIRRSQASERKATQEAILQSQEKIKQLNIERAPLATEVRQVEAEVGPIKYIAALIYGDNADTNVLEKAVRIVILMIVFVFDPLAVLMFIAVNQSLRTRDKPAIEEPQQTTQETISVNEPMVTTPEPQIVEKIVRAEPKKIKRKRTAKVKQKPETKQDPIEPSKGESVVVKSPVEWEKDRKLIPADIQI